MTQGDVGVIHTLHLLLTSSVFSVHDLSFLLHPNSRPYHFTPLEEGSPYDPATLQCNNSKILIDNVLCQLTTFKVPVFTLHYFKERMKFFHSCPFIKRLQEMSDSPMYDILNQCHQQLVVPMMDASLRPGK